MNTTNELLTFQGHIFDLDGTLVPSCWNLMNFIKLQQGKLPLNNGVREYLVGLKQQNKNVGIVSNVKKHRLVKYNAINALYPKYIDAIKATDSGKSKNDKSELILETLDDWEIFNQEAIYYGDRLSDAVSAHRACVKFCLVGNPKEKDLHEIQKISELHIRDFREHTFEGRSF